MAGSNRAFHGEPCVLAVGAPKRMRQVLPVFVPAHIFWLHERHRFALLLLSLLADRQHQHKHLLATVRDY